MPMSPALDPAREEFARSVLEEWDAIRGIHNQLIGDTTPCRTMGGPPQESPKMWVTERFAERTRTFSAFLHRSPGFSGSIRVASAITSPAAVLLHFF